MVDKFFEIYDKNNNGYLEKQEIADVFELNCNFSNNINSHSILPK